MSDFPELIRTSYNIFQYDKRLFTYLQRLRCIVIVLYPKNFNVTEYWLSAFFNLLVNLNVSREMEIKEAGNK